jgi:hypothetical protein
MAPSHKVSQMSALPRACQKSIVPNKECGMHLKQFYWFCLVSAFLTRKSASAQNSYGANHLVTTTFVQKLYKIKKKPKFIPSWENAPFGEPERSPRGIKFRLKIEGVFFLNPSQICAWLTNQSISPGFGPISCQNAEFCMSNSSEWPCGAKLLQNHCIL